MKLLLLGSTGRTGQRVLEKALEQGHTVHAVVRQAHKLKPQERLRVFEGDVCDPSLLRLALEGCEAVITTLNISRKNDFPWAPLRSPHNLLSTCMHALLQALVGAPKVKLVVCSAFGVGDSELFLPGWFHWLIRNSNIRVPYADHLKQEALVKQSGHAYVIVRPVGLTNGPAKQQYYLQNSPSSPPKHLVSRRTLAHCLLRMASDQQFGAHTLDLSDLS